MTRLTINGKTVHKGEVWETANPYRKVRVLGFDCRDDKVRDAIMDMVEQGQTVTPKDKRNLEDEYLICDIEGVADGPDTPQDEWVYFNELVRCITRLSTGKG